MDARALFSSVMGAFGAPAVVTPLGLDPVTTEVVWVPPSPEFAPEGMDFKTLSMRKVLAIPRSTVPICKVGTVVVVPEIDGGATKTWHVDGIERQEVDHTRALVTVVE